MKIRSRIGRDAAMKTAAASLHKKGSRRKKLVVKTAKAENEEKIELADNYVSTRGQRKKKVSDFTGKIGRDLLKLKCMVYGQKRTYLRDEALPLPPPHMPSPTLKELEEHESARCSADKTMKTQSPCDSSNTTASIVASVNDHGSKWAQACCHGGLRALLREFSTMRKFIPSGIKTEAFNKNGNKNRYVDVLCLDETRVILQGRPKDNDYIHANWVVLPSKRRYICTQGPLDETIEDFWLMVFKEKVPVIIMLCDIVEGGEAKCAEYYPAAIGKELTFGGIKVKNIQKEKPIDTIICFTLTVEMSSDTHKLLHYKWAEWPDRAAPPSASPLVELLRKTKPMFKSGPVVVHCSAGIGRTGTYCAVDYAIDQLGLGDSLSITEVVKDIRKQRLHSVQTALQYLYLHNCLVEYLVMKKVIPRDANVKKLLRDYEKYLKKYNERTRSSCIR